MRGLVVYESMHGNTHLVADAIARGLAMSDVRVVPVDRADQAMLERADLVVVGGPTHVHGMSRQSTRRAALDAARQPGTQLPGEEDRARAWGEKLARGLHVRKTA